jgi:16S rRNA (guanine527-N7)-methyltransferase
LKDLTGKFACPKDLSQSLRFLDFQLNYEEFQIIFKEGISRLGISMTPQQISSFHAYLGELILWNKRVNLVRRDTQQDIIAKDFFDSLTISKYLNAGISMADLGAGAGFPGIPIKIMRPDVFISLFEIKQKKIYFLRHMIRCLRLERIDVKREPGKESRQTFDVVVSRAFGTLANFLREGITMTKPEGILLAMKGRRGKVELEKNFSLIREMGLNLIFCDQLKLPFLGHERILIGLRKE